MNTKYFSCFLLFILYLFSILGCGSSDASNEEIPIESNPIVMSTELFGESGNLYKPRSDEKGAGAGTLAILLSSKFSKQFDSCEIRKRSGETAQLFCINDQPWTQIPFSCFSNGNRQTWRASFNCEDVGEVLVKCKDAVQEITFTVPEDRRNQVCSRFG